MNKIFFLKLLFYFELHFYFKINKNNSTFSNNFLYIFISVLINNYILKSIRIIDKKFKLLKILL